MSVMIIGGTGHLGSNLGRYFARVLNTRVLLYDVLPRKIGFLRELILQRKAIIEKGDVLNLAKLRETVKKHDVTDVIYTAVAFQARAKS
jgi:nucleoside-diphosphate-sugar epimerase